MKPIQDGKDNFRLGLVYFVYSKAVVVISIFADGLKLISILCCHRQHGQGRESFDVRLLQGNGR